MHKSLIITRGCNMPGIILILSFLLALFACKPENREFHRTDFNDFRFLEKGIEQITEGYNNGSYTIKELTEAYLDRIEEVDKNGPRINSVIFINPEAIRIAEELDREMKAGKIRGPMHGIPVILKDNIDTHDKMPSTGGSRALMNSYPLKDSHVARQLREAGAVIIGKANLSEWANFRGALSTSGWSGVGGQTRNPYDLSRNPCGSSSGSAAAVSANFTVLAIGTETNGSIVCPSHSNGIVGIKPTVGLISRSGIIPISYTQDTPGPMARTVRDAAICLGVLAGTDSTDEKTITGRGMHYKDYTQFLKKDGLKGKRIGLYKGPLGINFKVDTLLYTAVRYMESQGAVIIELDTITGVKTGNYSFDVLLFEYKDGLNSYFKSLGPDAPVKSLDELIRFNRADPVELKHFNQIYLEMANEKGDLSSRAYREALSGMLKSAREEGIDRVMDKHDLDAIIAPTGSPAWKTDLVNGDCFQLGSSSPAAQAGYPNITVPMGHVHGLPVGISFFGRAWSEPVLLEIAYAYETGTLHRRIPGFRNGD